MRDAFVARLCGLAARDDRIVLMTGDLGFKTFDEFRDRFPKRFINAGVAEQNMIGLATGLALEGRVVFAYSIANFATIRCLEQIRNDAAYHQVDVKVVAAGGGFTYGALGVSHHATEDLAIMRALPGITIVAPGDTYESGEATEALANTPGVGYLRLDRAGTTGFSGMAEPFKLGKARLVWPGSDCSIIAVGGIVSEALLAAQHLSSLGISTRVLSMHTVKPLDIQALTDAARETKILCTLEEHVLNGGLGGAVAEALLDAGVVPVRLIRIGLCDQFSSVVGSQGYLRGIYGLDARSIAHRLAGAIGKERA
jgi:transketolase